MKLKLSRKELQYILLHVQKKQKQEEIHQLTPKLKLGFLLNDKRDNTKEKNRLFSEVIES